MSNPDRLLRHRFRVSDGGLPLVANRGRDLLPSVFNEFGFKRGVEVGVEKGLFSEVICKSIPGVCLSAVDPWEGPYLRCNQLRMNDLYELAKERLEPYKVEILRMTSGEASRKIPDGSLDFVYIDGLHDFDSVIQDILWWVPKVRVGGIVSGHDYLVRNTFGVILAVDAYTRAHNVNPWYVTVDAEPSWFWVKK